MTTFKPYHAGKVSVTFGKPTVGPKIYLTKGPSGWPEQFSRTVADNALASFLAPLHVEEVLASFRLALQLEGREENWGDVIAHLAKVTGSDEKHVPEIAGVALWGRYLIHKRDEEIN